MSDFITISSSALPDDTRVAAFRAVEAISRPYEVEVFLLVPSEGLELADGIGAKARLILDRAHDKIVPFYFSGVFGSLELLHEFDGRTLVRGIIVPRIWQLGLSIHSRIFTKMSVREIIEAVLDDNALTDYELRLGSYPKEEHVCQYRESDLAFLSRWMEREGIFYFFEHTDEGEKLIICDDKSYEKDPIGIPVRYHPQSGGDHSAGASFRSFRCRHATLPATVKLKDYDYTKPNLDVSGTASVSDAGTAEVSIYGDRFFTPGDGKRLAQLRAEGYKAREVVYQAAGTRLHIRPGYVFELEEHPRAPFNAEYVATEVTHSGNQATGGSGFREFIELDHEDVYLVEVSAIPGKKQFRAEQSTPWPRIYSFENGIVDGAADSEYAQIDDHGRYLVKFKFDESALKNGKASTFIRMMQPHGGGVEGFHFPLRKGTEVMFSFLGGDPDRPVISGTVPNVLTPSPVTGSNHTKNVIQTGGRNRIELEDQSGQQWIHTSTPYETTFMRMGLPFGTHELHLQTNKNTLLNAGENYDLKVGQIEGSGNWNALIKTDWKTHVEKGGLSIGVVTGPGSPQVGAFGLIANTHISMQAETGNFALHVDKGTATINIKKDTTFTVSAGKYEHTVTGGPTHISNTDNTTLIDSKGRVKLHSKEGPMFMRASKQILMKSETDKIDIEAAKDITISAPGQTIKTVSKEFKSESDFTWISTGEWKDFTKGKFTAFKFADWIEIGMSAKAELSASISLAAKLSVTLEFAHTIDLKTKFAKKETCMTMMLESPWIDMKAMAVMITTPLLQSTSALKVI